MTSQRDYYFPNTEPLAAAEMRVIALGTGRPFVRRGQANCSWLIELGNGDKFVFDFGSGSQANFTALEIPHQDITAYFATHLHADHVGDFAQVWIGSWAGGRVKPLVLYGPSGPEPKYGTEHFVRKQMESLAWDTDTRLGLLPDAGAEVEVHEFDFRQTGVVYDHNGVVIRSFPAIHIYDGPVSYRLEWNGLCFVFSGDTTPSRFFVDNAQGADLLIHECFNTVQQLIERSGYPEKSAIGIGTMAHTAPEECGKVLNLVRPRQAVVFHFFNDFDTAPEIERDIRKHYQGPLALAQDLMVFNVTPERIRTRLAVTPMLVWPNKERHDAFREAPRRKRPTMSRWLADQQLFPKFGNRGGAVQRPTRRQILGGAVLAPLTAGRVRAAGYPERPIRVVSPYAAGGVGENIMHLLGVSMEPRLGQKLVLEAKPGAAGNLGTEDVARAAPDGETILIGATNNFVINQFVMRMTFDPLQSLAPIAKAAEVPLVLFSNPAVPARTLGDFIAYAKAHPGTVNYGVPSLGTVNHLLMERLKQTAGAEITCVPYRGSPPAVLALLKNEIQIFPIGLAAVGSNLRDGKLTALAVATAQRVPMLPDVPTIAESGFPGFAAANWFGLAAPAGTPDAILDILADAIAAAQRTDLVQDRFATLGMLVPSLSRPEFAASLQAEAAFWRETVQRGHISIE